MQCLNQRIAKPLVLQCLQGIERSRDHHECRFEIPPGARLQGGKGDIQRIERTSIFQQRIGEIFVRRLRWFERKRLRQMLCGFSGVRLAQQQNAEIGMRVGMVGVELQRLAILRDRLAVLTEARIDETETVARLGILPVSGDRALDQIDGGVALARLVMKDAEMRERADMQRGEGERVAVQHFGFAQPSRLMQLNRRVE